MNIYFQPVIKTAFFLVYKAHELLCAFLIKNISIVSRIFITIAFIPLFGIGFPEYSKAFGSMALDVLIGTLFLSPLTKILHWKILYILMGFRKHLGIFFSCLAIAHVMGSVSYLGIMRSLYFILSFSGYTALAWAFGFIAFFITILLFVTSNKCSVHLLRTYWKRLHRLAYLLIILILIHKALLSGLSSNSSFILIIKKNVDSIAILFVYTILKYLAWKKVMWFVKLPEIIRR